MDEDTARKTRRTRTKDWRPKFLKLFAGTGNIKLAAEGAKIARNTAYLEMGRNSEFAALCEDAKEEALDVLEAEVFRRGVTGVEVPKSIGGQRELVREYDTTLLLAQLNAHGKKRGYTRESRIQLSGQIDQKHTVRVTTDKRRTYAGKAGPSSNGAVATNGATEART
ncbi:MAG: hypothetical protein V3S20_08350 [Dehalococcoidia bacterium]